MNIQLASVLGCLLGLAVLLKRNTQVSSAPFPCPSKLLDALPVFFHEQSTELLDYSLLSPHFNSCQFLLHLLA